MNEKEHFHFEILKNYFLSGEKNILDLFSIRFNLSKSDYYKLSNILYEFEKKGFHYLEFEKELEDSFGLTHESFKLLIHGLHQAKRWNAVVEKYIQSVYKESSDIPSVYAEIKEELEKQGILFKK